MVDPNGEPETRRHSVMIYSPKYLPINRCIDDISKIVSSHAEPNGGWDDIPIGITCIDRHLYSVLSQSLLYLLLL